LGADRRKPGPSGDRLHTEGDWEKGVNTALKKRRPKDGWPEPAKQSKKMAQTPSAGKK